MIAEPYICIEGEPMGKICWYQEGCPSKQCDETGWWKSYADFEREKLGDLDAEMAHVGISGRDGYFLQTETDCYDSRSMKIMNGDDYADASESSRLLKRAEFLKAVCEKEGVSWLSGPIEVKPEPVVQYPHKDGMLKIYETHMMWEPKPKPQCVQCQPKEYEGRCNKCKNRLCACTDCFMKLCKPPVGCECDVPIDYGTGRDTYTKAEIDKALEQCDKYSLDRITDDRDDEKQFREELLDVLDMPIHTGKSWFKALASLREKFL